MIQLDFTTSLNASAAKVWQILWDDACYRRWTSAFHIGSYAVSDWKEGSSIHFLTPEGSGMSSVIKELRPQEYMAFEHLRGMKNFVEEPDSEANSSWKHSIESYQLIEENGMTTLSVSIESDEKVVDYFKTTFPKALILIKELAENPLMLEVSAQVAKPANDVWELWTSPQHIMKWNSASDDWHTPHSENDLRVGGKFTSTMAAKDGSFSFDFGGTYTEVIENKIIAYTMDDGRTARIVFTENPEGTHIKEVFEAENSNPTAMQTGGWQSIMNNFKKYAERKQ